MKNKKRYKKFINIKIPHSLYTTNQIEISFSKYITGNKNQKYVSIITCFVFYENPNINDEIEKFSIS